MSRLICFDIVFLANVILAGLTVKHLCEGTGASVSNKKANHTSSASPTHLRFLISTDVQILFVCQLTNQNICYASSISHLNSSANPLRLSAHKPWPIPKHLLTLHMSQRMPRCLLKSRMSLNNDMFCTKPATKQATHRYLRYVFQYPRVGVE